MAHEAARQRVPRPMIMTKLISYLRVSTEEQGADGLGVDAQRRAITAWCALTGAEVVQEFVEVASGGRETRPVLAQALAAAKAIGGQVVVSKLDRLSRSSRQVVNMVADGAPFIALDIGLDTGTAQGRFQVELMGSLGQLERGLIGERTKAALAALKANPKTRDRHPGVRSAAAANAGYQSVREAIAGALEAVPGGSLRELCRYLNATGANRTRTVHPRSGKRWSPSSMSRALDHLGLDRIKVAA